MQINWMLVILGVAALLVAVSFWRAHRTPGFAFNAFDLLMEDGKVSRVAFWFMVAGAVSTWVIVDMQIKDKLTEGMFGLWLTAWVAPLIAKMVFGKTDMPTGTTFTSSTTTTELTKDAS